MADASPSVQSGWVSVRDHARQFSDFALVYPVISRRSRGLSLGINLNPDKICNFDCVYCEVDRTAPGKATRVDLDQLQEELVALIRLIKEGGLDRWAKFSDLSALTRDIKDLAFSGDGEPTLVHNFAECVRLTLAVKQAEKLDRTKIVLITDAAGLDKSSVQEGLRLMDTSKGEVWAKLDAGTEAYFKLINRSHVQFDRILRNLLETGKARPIIIQSMFLRWHGERMPSAELSAYCARLNELTAGGAHIKEVHAYTIARPTPDAGATALTTAELEAVADQIRHSTGMAVLAFP
jgi:wyosine [tRNA(Phe)-imidazoG37] synthetase (radical SAM superfamily)